MRFDPVPDDRLIDSPNPFEKPSLDFLRERFELLHRASEQIYEGDGVWGHRLLGPKFPPQYKNTAWRMIGYANAMQVDNNDRYRARFMEGAEYLLTEQQDNGSYLWWLYKEEGWPDTHHLLYCTANPAVALVEAYKLTSDQRFLDAAVRAADWAMKFGLSGNNNYNSFAVWQLAETYRVTGDRKYLDAAWFRNKYGALVQQLPNGAWAGHNAWIFYHCIILNGCATLYGVMPDDHPDQAELKRMTTMGLNHLIYEQRPNGLFRSCFDPEEWERSRNPESPYSKHLPEKFAPFGLQALVNTDQHLELDVTNAIHGILQSPLDEQEVIDLNVKEEWADYDAGISTLAWGMAFRWLAQQDEEACHARTGAT